MTTFQLHGLAAATFQHYFDQSDDYLRLHDITRVRATTSPGFPCRVSLQDADVGDELLLLPYQHHDVQSPYKSMGPIYVRKGANQAILAPGVIPAYVDRRIISLRAYDASHMMIEADVLMGTKVALALERMFEDPSVSYVHLHNAKQGCFSCLATRVVSQS